MNIKQCVEIYDTLLGKQFQFNLDNSEIFTFSFTIENFYHLLGLHKLKDIFNNRTNKRAIYNNLKKDDSDILCNLIQSSVHYVQIEHRITHFDAIRDLFDINKCNVVVDFDYKKANPTKLIKTKYIIYKKYDDGSYFMLTIQNRKNRFFPETILYETTNKYHNEQTFLDVISINIMD